MTTATRPSLEELEATLQDQAQIATLINEGRFGEFVKDYADAKNGQHADIAEQVKEQTQQVLGQWLRDNQGDAVKRVNLDPSQPVAGRSAQRQGLYNPKAIGAKLDGEFEGSGDFFTAIWHGRDRDAELSAKLGRVRNAMSSTVPSEGGFLVPEALRSELLRVSLETSIVRPRARVIPMETARVAFPAIDSTSNASSVYGGIVGYWTEEAAALTASQASFSRVVLDAKKLTAYTEVPNELVADSIISLQAFIDDIFPEALGYYEDLAFISGTGVGEPLGVLNSAAAISVTKESGQTASTIVWENVVKMYARMLPSSLSRAVWIANINTFPELATMALTVGTGGAPVWLSNGAEGPPMTILGRPVIFTEKVPSVGTVGDLAFVDFGFYLIGDRMAMTAASSPHYKFQNDLTAYRIIERVDGRPWVNSAITPKTGSTTLSPIVQLATRA